MTKFIVAITVSQVCIHIDELWRFRFHLRGVHKAACLQYLSYSVFTRIGLSRVLYVQVQHCSDTTEYATRNTNMLQRKCYIKWRVWIKQIWLVKLNLVVYTYVIYSEWYAAPADNRVTAWQNAVLKSGGLFSECCCLTAQTQQQSCNITGLASKLDISGKLTNTI